MPEKLKIIKHTIWKHQWDKYGSEEWTLNLYNDDIFEITTTIENTDKFQEREDIEATIDIPAQILRKFLESKHQCQWEYFDETQEEIVYRCSICNKFYAIPIDLGKKIHFYFGG